MEILLYIIALLAIFIIGYIIYLQQNKTTKSPALKKNEIIDQYKKELQNLINTNNYDKELLITQKKIFLKKCNSELARNIFFTQDEAHQVIKELSKI